MSYIRIHVEPLARSKMSRMEAIEKKRRASSKYAVRVWAHWSTALALAILGLQIGYGDEPGIPNPQDTVIVHGSVIDSVTVVKMATSEAERKDTPGIPHRPEYCAVIDADGAPSTSMSVPAKLNKGGRLCHPPESPYYSFTRGAKLGTLEDCRKFKLELPDVLRRVCVSAVAERKQALDAVIEEAKSVKEFIQKTHVAVALQARWKPEFSAEPSLMLHTIVRSLSFGGMPELQSWVWGPYVALSPPVEFGLDASPSVNNMQANSTATDDPTTANTPPMSGTNQVSQDKTRSSTFGLGFLLSKRPSFDKHGFSVGLGYWWGSGEEGVQLVVSTNLMSFPRK